MSKDKEIKYVGVISLGCDKNRVDTEHMLTYLGEGGYKFTSDPTKAHIIIVNTCGFIANARKESMETIFEMAEYKKVGMCEKLVVTGCMPQKWLGEMRKELPEVDVFMGTNEYPNIVSILDKAYETNKKVIEINGDTRESFVKNRVVTTPKHYAYLKIADGCDNFCTFCTIPYIRGRYRSRDMKELLTEAKKLVDGGATELILVAQDVTRYGSELDKEGKSHLVELVRELSKIKDLKYIRLLYCYPELISDELLDEMMNNPKLCNYLDIPFQHVSDGILKRMSQTASGPQMSQSSRSMTRSSICHRSLICSMEKWSVTTSAAIPTSNRSLTCWKMLFRNFLTKWIILFCTQIKVGSTR